MTTSRGLGDGAPVTDGDPGAARPELGREAGLTRRRFLIGGGVLAAAAAVLGAVGWRSWTVRGYWYRLTGAYGPAGTPPPSYPVVYRKGTFPSSRLAEPAEYEVAYPPDVDPENAGLVSATPVLICLPGRARSAEAVLQGGLRFGDFVADAVRRRAATPFLTVAVRAGDTYWHERSSGVDAMAMLLDEFIPFLRDDLGLGGTLGIMGWSMGGYGALRAAESRPREFRAVCAVSAALWRAYDDGVGDAFDDAADYAADDVYAHADRLRDVAVRVDCGEQDPFYAADRAFAEALPRPPAGGFGPGGHNDAYWTRVAPAEIDWMANELGRTAP